MFKNSITRKNTFRIFFKIKTINKLFTFYKTKLIKDKILIIFLANIFVKSTISVLKFCDQMNLIS